MKSIGYINSRIKTYVETIYVVAAKNVKLRYKNSFLGFLWTLINPLFMLSIFIFVFGKLITNIENYPLFVISGLIFWNFFVTSSNQMINKIIESGGILKSVSIPPIIFPLSSLASNLFNFFLTLIPFFGLMIYWGYQPTWTLLALIPIIVLFVLFTFGISITLSCLNVYFRDIEMFWTTISPALFYATPVVYSTPKEIEHIMLFNPFSHFMNMVRSVIYYNEIPDLNTILISVSLTILMLGIGMYTYMKLRKGFISNI